MAILDAIKAIQTACANVSGIKSAPNYPGAGEKPIVITHLATGTITPGNPAGARLELHNIAVELHVAEDGDLPGSFTTLETLHPLMVAALVADITFGGTLQMYASISYSTVRTSWDGVNTLSRVYVLNNAKIIA
jgi:hypothetical protein